MDITFIIEFIITLLLLIATRYLLPMLKNKYGVAKITTAYEIIKILVKAVEQTCNVTGAGAKKKAQVIERLKDYNVTLDEAKVSELIESAVKEMNDNVKEA